MCLSKLNWIFNNNIGEDLNLGLIWVNKFLLCKIKIYVFKSHNISIHLDYTVLP